MATVNDTLNTTLRLVGLAQYLSGIALVTAAFRQFAQESDVLFRAQRLFTNLNVNEPIDKLTASMTRLSRETGFSRVELERTYIALTQAGVRANLVAPALRAIADAAAGNAEGLDFEASSRAYIRGVLGQDRALKAFGITAHDLGSRLANLNRINYEFSIRFAGDAARRLNTLTGALDHLSSAWQQLLSAAGNNPAIITWINRIARALEYLADHIQEVIRLFGFLFGIVGPTEGRGPNANPAAAASRNPQLATERTAQQIADNTGRQLDAVEQAILGGPGLRARQAFTFRDATIALRI